MTMNYTDRTPALRYYDCGDRLDVAILKNDSKRIALLRYAQDMLAAETREALEQERKQMSKMLDELSWSIAMAFGSSQAQIEALKHR